MPPDQPSTREQRGFIARVTFTGVLTVVFLLVAAMTAAYVWGVMSGRRATFAESGATPAQISQIPAPDIENADKRKSILKPHELDFVHELRGDPRPISKARTQTPKKTTAEDASPIAKPETTESAPPTNQAPTPPPSANSPKTEPETPGAIYDHVFQMAALKDEQAVDALREQLEGHGFRTRLERSGKLLIVLVLLRGNAARAAEVYQIARDLRLGQPLLRGKKPVP